MRLDEGDSELQKLFASLQSTHVAFVVDRSG